MEEMTVTGEPIRVLWLVKGLGPGGAEQLLLLSARVADRTGFAHRLLFVRPDKTHLVADFEAAGLVPELLGAGEGPGPAGQGAAAGEPETAGEGPGDAAGDAPGDAAGEPKTVGEPGTAGEGPGGARSRPGVHARSGPARGLRASRAAGTQLRAAGRRAQAAGRQVPAAARQARALREALAQADIVHVHSPVLASAARLLSRTLPPARRPAVVTTEHNEWTSHRRPTRLLNALTSPLDAHHWAVSDQVRATVWPTHRHSYEVLVHGIDPAAVAVPEGARARLRGEFGIADDEVLVLTVANLRANKDYPNLLRAASIALQREPRLRFVAVGQGPLADQVAALHAELGLGERVILAGYRRDIPELMAAADVFALGSAHEGLPVAVMEAFAAGLPVVATMVGGIPGQVRDGVTGLLVPRRDAEALAAALVAIAADDAQRAQLAAAARQNAGRYDIRLAVTRQEAIYRQLARPAGELGTRRG